MHTTTRLNIFNTSGECEWLQTVQAGEYAGALSSAAISGKGDVAYLAMKEDGYESDQNWVRIVKSGKAEGVGRQGIDVTATSGLEKEGKEGKEDGFLVKGREMSPSQITWSLDGKSLYLIADVHGRASVFRYHLDKESLERVNTTGSASSIIDTPHGLLITASSFTHPARIYLDSRQLTSTPSLSSHLDIQDFWFAGSSPSQKLHGFTLNPGIKKAPLAFLIHGGPQSAWTDAWSTRWNPALMALQGYFVVVINPTGSTGYGQDFVDAIQYNWGGSPYKDLVAGYHAVLGQYEEWIDANRTAALGGSYGGYMINWIQGHNPGFKALVCHDGTFDTTTSHYTTEEVYFMRREFGDPVDNRAMYEKWNPMNHVGNWKTPELVIHSANDFRLVNSHGVAAFTALQSRGVPSRYLFFPDENHWVLKPSNSMRWHYEVFRWLEEWVGHGEKVDERSKEVFGQLEQLETQAQVVF